MENIVNSSEIIDILRKAITLKKTDSDKSNKLPETVLIDYIKISFISSNDLAKKAFVNFYNYPDNERIAGKFETWLEIAIQENTEALDGLNNRLEHFNNSLNNNLPEKNIDKETEKPEDNEKTNSIEEPIVEIKKKTPKAKKRPIIVPWDFSDIANFALNHALLHSKNIGEKIILLHITKSDREIDEASVKMTSIVDKIYKQSNIKPEFMVETGNILKTITQIANDKNARFVIMGTHGIKGMQKFTGSLALKVITGTEQPFIVVQKNPEKATIKTVALPVDNRRENKQKLKQVLMLSKYYSVKYVLIMPENITSEHLNKSTRQNLAFIKSYMAQQGIEHEVFTVKGTTGYAEAALKYAEEEKPDMMMILTTKNINLQDYVLGAEEQKIIANPSKVPVMCINPMETKYTSVGFTG